MTNLPRVCKLNIDLYHYFNLHIHKPLNIDPKTIFFIQSYDLNTQFPDPNSLSYFSAGMHPWNLNDEKTSENLESLCKLSKLPKFLAIGEIGFDPLGSPGIELQKKSFRVQAELGEDLKKPLIIHCVRSYSLLLEMKKIIQPKMPWIVHGYRKNLVLANELISKGFFLSIGIILFKDLKLQKTIQNLPLTSLFLETDDSRDSIIDLTELICKIKNISHNHFIDIQRSLYSQIFTL
jgi:TatD DNase family protein